MHKAFKWGAAGVIVTTAGALAGIARRRPTVGPGGRPVIPAREPADLTNAEAGGPGVDARPGGPREGIDSPRGWRPANWPPATSGKPEELPKIHYGGADDLDVTYTKPGDEEKDDS